MGYTAEEGHAWESSITKASPKACLECVGSDAEAEDRDSVLGDETKMASNLYIKYKDKCMVHTVKHGGGGVLMWDVMSAAGVIDGS